MPATELRNKRFFPADAFGHGHAQFCLKYCGNTLFIEKLEEGQIWQCGRCLAKHEFHMEYTSGPSTPGVPSGRVRYGVVWLLEGTQPRSKGEPSIIEFLEE